MTKDASGSDLSACTGSLNDHGVVAVAFRIDFKQAVRTLNTA